MRTPKPRAARADPNTPVYTVANIMRTTPRATSSTPALTSALWGKGPWPCSSEPSRSASLPATLLRPGVSVCRCGYECV